MEVFLIVRPRRRPRRHIDLVNNNIHFREVMLVGEGTKRIISTYEAQKLANNQNLDLVIVQAKTKPPVAKIMNWGKAKFQRQKKARENKKKQVTIQIKEVRLSPVIGEGDFQTRKKAATKFLSSGDKVKLNLRFRGRMMTHKDIGRNVLLRMANELKDLSNVEQKPKMLGRQMSLLLSPKREVIKKLRVEKKNEVRKEKNAKNEN